jgi:hypothetical protein
MGGGDKDKSKRTTVRDVGEINSNSSSPQNSGRPRGVHAALYGVQQHDTHAPTSASGDDQTPPQRRNTNPTSFARVATNNENNITSEYYHSGDFNVNPGEAVISGPVSTSGTGNIIGGYQFDGDGTHVFTSFPGNTEVHSYTYTDADDAPVWVQRAQERAADRVRRAQARVADQIRRAQDRAERAADRARRAQEGAATENRENERGESLVSNYIGAINAYDNSEVITGNINIGGTSDSSNSSNSSPYNITSSSSIGRIEASDNSTVLTGPLTITGDNVNIGIIGNRIRRWNNSGERSDG